MITGEVPGILNAAHREVVDAKIGRQCERGLPLLRVRSWNAIDDDTEDAVDRKSTGRSTLISMNRNISYKPTKASLNCPKHRIERLSIIPGPHPPRAKCRSLSLSLSDT